MLLAFESSCDETSVAVVSDGVVLSNVVATQIRMHAEYGGVVPELAVREHLKNLKPVCTEALRLAGVGVEDLRAVGATRGPGLPAALAAGYAAAQGFCAATGLPLIGVNHHEGHLYSPWISGEPPRADWAGFRRNVSLIVSGGHTLLVLVEAPGKHRVLGGTLDDAAGECFDKLAKVLGLPYPGGPVLDRLAEEGNPASHVFPRPLLHEPHDDFSFSGLKTSVRYYLDRRPGLAEDMGALKDLCAAIRAAVVDTLVGKLLRAARRTGVTCVTASGGVTCNRALRRDLARECAAQGFELRLAEPRFCTDNAGMVGVVAEYRWRQGQASDAPELEVTPGWSLEEIVA
jgi:N6-L-threonylcarbamoyladenine synthase